PLHEEVVEHRVLVVELVLLARSDVLLGREARVVVVEAGDEALPVLVLLVRRAPVPPVEVPVDDEVLVARVTAVHGVPSLGWRSPPEPPPGPRPETAKKNPGIPASGTFPLLPASAPGVVSRVRPRSRVPEASWPTRSAPAGCVRAPSATRSVCAGRSPS